MALNINVPLPGQTLAFTQNPIRGNFITINTAFNFDHVEFNTVGQGKHKKITMPNLAAPAAPVGNDILLYNAADVAAIAQLFLRKTGGTPVPVSQGTDTGVNGFFWVPAGYQIKFGVFTVAMGTAPYVFQSVNGYPAPFSTACVWAIAVPKSSVVNVVTVTGFTVNNVTIQATGNSDVWYLAIGY